MGRASQYVVNSATCKYALFALNRSVKQSELKRVNVKRLSAIKQEDFCSFFRCKTNGPWR